MYITAELSCIANRLGNIVNSISGSSVELTTQHNLQVSWMQSAQCKVGTMATPTPPNQYRESSMLTYVMATGENSRMSLPVVTRKHIHPIYDLEGESVRTAQLPSNRIHNSNKTTFTTPMLLLRIYKYYWNTKLLTTSISVVPCLSTVMLMV